MIDMSIGANVERLAIKIEDGVTLDLDDKQAIMGLLGYEVALHARLGTACRPMGGSHWQSMPTFRDASKAEIWLHPEDTGGHFDEITQDAGDSRWAASFNGQHGNQYGESKSLGLAMFAAFVRSEGRAEQGEE